MSIRNCNTDHHILRQQEQRIKELEAEIAMRISKSIYAIADSILACKDARHRLAMILQLLFERGDKHG